MQEQQQKVQEAEEKADEEKAKRQAADAAVMAAERERALLTTAHTSALEVQESKAEARIQQAADAASAKVAAQLAAAEAAATTAEQARVNALADVTIGRVVNGEPVDTGLTNAVRTDTALIELMAMLLAKSLARSYLLQVWN